MNAPHDRENESIGDLWAFYAEHAAQSRQNESLRATAISIMCDSLA